MGVLMKYTKSCQLCRKEFGVQQYLINRKKFCSSDCYHNSTKGSVPWNKNTHGLMKVVYTGQTINCIVCGKKKYFEQNQLRRRPCRYCSVRCARKSERKTFLKYSSVHSRIKKDWGNAKKCFICGTSKCVDWANVSKSYLLARDDWLELCRKHHIAYDKGKLKIVFPMI